MILYHSKAKAFAEQFRERDGYKKIKGDKNTMKVESYNSKGEIITDNYKITIPELEEFLTEVWQRLEKKIKAQS